MHKHTMDQGDAVTVALGVTQKEGMLSNMNDRMQAGMADATRLVRTGRLAEATAMIQRTLGSLPATTVSADEPGSAGATIESGFPVLGDSSPSTGTPVEGAARSRRIGGESIPARLAAALRTLSPDTTGRFPDSMSGLAMPTRPVTPEVMPSSTHTGGQFIDGTYSNAAGTSA